MRRCRCKLRAWFIKCSCQKRNGESDGKRKDLVEMKLLVEKVSGSGAFWILDFQIRENQLEF
jgi:hypothetical protein